jgi:hypothetical protein
MQAYPRSAMIPIGTTIVIGFCLSEPFFITIDLLNYFEKCLAKCVAELKLVERLLGILLEVNFEMMFLACRKFELT